MNNRTLVDPLLDIHFTGMEIDFFAEVDRQYIRVFTLVADVHLPVGLEVGSGTLTPVLGDVADAFTNVSVKNTEAVTESPATLAALFPTLLDLVLPQLSGGLPALTLPALGGLNLNVTSITAVDDHDGGDGVGDFLGIFANLVPATMMRPAVETTFDITNIEEPADAIVRDPLQWRGRHPAAVTLALGSTARDAQWQVRVDNGLWSPWSGNPHPTLSPRVFWLPGIHRIDVRSRELGHPESADLSPARLDVPLGMSIIAQSKGAHAAPVDEATGLVDPFHGGTGTADGCTCNGGWRRRRRCAVRARSVRVRCCCRCAACRRYLLQRVRGAKKLGATVWLAALACLPGCSCGSKPCGDRRVHARYAERRGRPVDEHSAG